MQRERYEVREEVIERYSVSGEEEERHAVRGEKRERYAVRGEERERKSERKWGRVKGRGIESLLTETQNGDTKASSYKMITISV